MVVVLLLVGVVIMARLIPRRAARPTLPPSSAASPTPAPAITFEQVRERFSSTRPFDAVRMVLAILETSPDPVACDLALQEMEEHLEGLDRLTLYKVLDDYHKRPSSPRARQVDRLISAIVGTKSFLFERHNPAKAAEEFTRLAGEKDSFLAPFALNKLAGFKVSDDPRQAMELFKRQIEEFGQSPLNGFASLMIGTCLRALDRDKEALVQYKATLSRYRNAHAQRGLPLEPFIRHALGDTYVRLGDRESARGELTIVKERFKEYPYLGIVEETLKTMGA